MVSRPAAILERIGSALGVIHGIDLEYSLRLCPGRVEADGRFGCWLDGTGPEGFAPVARVLERLGAPAAVVEAQRGAVLPVRQGIAVALDEAGPEYRLYLHCRDPATLADRYTAWRWQPGAEARRSRYAFHYLPETPAGVRPLDLVDARLRPGFALLLEDARLRQCSGFWLREAPDGAVEQLDLALPWYPVAGELPGVAALATALGIPEADTSGWRRLPIRHIATRVGAAEPAVTLYTSSPCDGPWPTELAELHARVRRGAMAMERQARRLYRGIPPAPPARRATAGATTRLARDLGAFYDGPNSVWEKVLGAGLHYHAGLFEEAELTAPDLAAPEDAAMDSALRRAVTALYPFIREGGRVYDIGCGWGGPLGMLVRDLGCPTLGLTNSAAQFLHVAGLGLPVRWGDAEATLPPGHFDCILLLESLSHIRDKPRLLRRLRPFGERLVLRVNCQDAAQPARAFGGTMHMISSTRLQAILEAGGWRIRHWRNRRLEALPSVAVWHRRLRALPPTGDRHLETLRAWCARVMLAPAAWARSNPLIEVMAE